MAELAAEVEKVNRSNAKVADRFDMYCIDPWYLTTQGNCLYDDSEHMDKLLLDMHTCAQDRCVAVFFTSWQRAHRIFDAAKRNKNWQACNQLHIWQTKGKLATTKSKKPGKLTSVVMEYAVVLYHYTMVSVKKKKKNLKWIKDFHGSRNVFPQQLKHGGLSLKVNGHVWSNYTPPSKYQRLWASFGEKPLRPQAEKNPAQYAGLFYYHLPLPKPGESHQLRVADLCSGSAAMGRAAIRLGIQYVGIDMDDKIVRLSQDLLYQAIIAKSRSQVLRAYHNSQDEVNDLHTLLEVTPFASLSNAPVGTLKEHCETMNVEVRQTNLEIAAGSVDKGLRGPVGKGLYGQRDIAGPTGVFLFGNFVLKDCAKTDERECIAFRDQRLRGVKMVIVQECPAFFINHFEGISDTPNCEFRELETWDQDMSAEKAHTLVEVHALRPIKEGEQWTVDYGSTYRVDFEKQAGQELDSAEEDAVLLLSASARQNKKVDGKEEEKEEEQEPDDGDYCAMGKDCAVIRGSGKLPPRFKAAHHCIVCERPIHGICGSAVSGKEGHGAPRRCGRAGCAKKP